MKAAAVRDPYDWQEAHSPTEFVEVKISEERTTQMCRRRKLDARLIEGMTTWEQDAANLIYEGHVLLAGASGYKPQSFERKEPARETLAERQADVMDAYWAWSIRALREKLQPSAVVLILANGWTCRDVDSFRRKRKGWASENLKECLRLYCRMKGWPTSC